MDILVFCERLYYEIKKLGIPDDKASAYVLRLRKQLSPEDIADTTYEDVVKQAKICASFLLADAPTENTKSDSMSDTKVVPKAARTVSAPVKKTDASINTNSTEEMGTATDTAPKTGTDDISDRTAEQVSSDSSVKASPKGIAMLILITAVSSPLWLICAAVFFAPFIIMFVSEFALTAAFICLLAGGTAAGTAASLTGIVYGIVKVFSTPAIGLYEIGFGIIIGGVTMMCGILIYNGAVRFMPWLIRKTGQLYRFTFSKVKPLLAEYKRRCTGL